MVSNRIVLISSLALSIGFTNAQKNVDVSGVNHISKPIQAGLTMHSGVNMVTPGLVQYMDKKDGLSSNFGVGMMFVKSFKSSPNIGFQSGLEFDFDKISYESRKNIYYDYKLNVIQTNVLSDSTCVRFKMDSRKQNTIFATVPLFLVFRTQYVGDFRYFGKFGIRNSFLFKNTINDLGSLVDTAYNIDVQNVENIRFENPGETFLYRGTVGVSAGAEWKFIESTSLVAEIGYHYGFTPLYFQRKNDKRTLYEVENGQRNYFSNKANLNQLLFKISILF